MISNFRHLRRPLLCTYVPSVSKAHAQLWRGNGNGASNFELPNRRSLHTTEPMFYRRVEGPSDSAEGEGGYRMYRNLAVFLFIPVILLIAGNLYMTHKHPKRQPFVNYDSMRRRTKRFPWGDGTKSLFHNPHINPLPGGYETEEEEEEEEKTEEG